MYCFFLHDLLSSTKLFYSKLLITVTTNENNSIKLKLFYYLIQLYKGAFKKTLPLIGDNRDSAGGYESVSWAACHLQEHILHPGNTFDKTRKWILSFYTMEENLALVPRCSGPSANNMQDKLKMHAIKQKIELELFVLDFFIRRGTHYMQLNKDKTARQRLHYSYL